LSCVNAGLGFPALVQEFFTSYLVEQRAVSSGTVSAYRDAFTLLFDYAERSIGKVPTKLTLADIDPDLIVGFLNELETVRGNCIRTRNARLAAIRSFLHFASRRDVSQLNAVAKALAVPMKRFERPMLEFLTREQMVTVLALPGTTWLAERDRLLLHLLYNTGAR
jgi:site-specific recombinase XerD